MITYLTLFISGLLGFLALFLNSTKDKRTTKDFKKLTAPGWIIFGFMILSLILSLVAQKVKDDGIKRDFEIKQKKDSISALQNNLIFQKVKKEEILAKQQALYSKNLLSESHKIDSAQANTIKTGNDFNSYLKNELKNQKFQISRQQTLFGTLKISYLFTIPSKQPYIEKYFNRVIDSNWKSDTGGLLSRAEQTPEEGDELQLYDFTHDLAFRIFIFDREIHSINELYSKNPKMRLAYFHTLKHHIVPTSRVGDTETFDFNYILKNSLFVYNVVSYPTDKYNDVSMISLADFAGKYCYFINTGQNGLSFEYNFIQMQFITESNQTLILSDFKKFSDGVFFTKIPEKAKFE